MNGEDKKTALQIIERLVLNFIYRLINDEDQAF